MSTEVDVWKFCKHNISSVEASTDLMFSVYCRFYNIVYKKICNMVELQSPLNMEVKVHLKSMDTGQYARLDRALLKFLFSSSLLLVSGSTLLVANPLRSFEGLSFIHCNILMYWCVLCYSQLPSDFMQNKVCEMKCVICVCTTLNTRVLLMLNMKINRGQILKTVSDQLCFLFDIFENVCIWNEYRNSDMWNKMEETSCAYPILSTRAKYLLVKVTVDSESTEIKVEKPLERKCVIKGSIYGAFA